MKYLTRILTFASLFIISFQSNAQSLKHLFNNIENGNIENAEKDFNNFNENKNYPNTTLYLYGLAACLIEINEKSGDYNPYVALEDYNKLNLTPAETEEVNVFLNKFQLSFASISDSIFKKIVFEAEKQNTESGYQKALVVCYNCKYKYKLESLKENAAYIECIKKGTSDAYTYFISKYSYSEHLSDVKKLIEQNAFNKAKQESTLTSMNNFIKEYPKGEFNQLATDLRDSLAYPELPINYNNAKNYIENYPSSKYTKKLKNEMPTLLYQKALSDNSIESMELFIRSYPYDSRIVEVSRNLEAAYSKKLQFDFNMPLFLKFKKMFPQSTFMTNFNNKYNLVFNSSDWHKDGMVGNVKVVTTIEKKREDALVERRYNEYGKITSISTSGSFNTNTIELEQIFVQYPINYFDIEYTFQLPLGSHIMNYEMVEHTRGWGGDYNYQYKYNSQNQLMSINDFIYIYDNNGQLIERTIFDCPSKPSGNYCKTKYKWINGKLNSKISYYEDGLPMEDLIYSIDYYENIAIIRVLGVEKIEERAREIEYNSLGLIKTVTYKAINYNFHHRGETILSIIDYTYDNNSRLIQLKASELDYHRDRKFENLYTFKYDEHNNVIELNKGDFNKKWKYDYIYDSVGNWIKRTQYEVSERDIVVKTKIGEIDRTITYY